LKFSFIKIVKNISSNPENRRDADTLLPFIERHVELGTTIWTDFWRRYNGLEALEYDHQTVNYTTNFVDPITGAKTKM